MGALKQTLTENASADPAQLPSWLSRHGTQPYGCAVSVAHWLVVPPLPITVRACEHATR
jgi:hypothetical protein